MSLIKISGLVRISLASCNSTTQSVLGKLDSGIQKKTQRLYFKIRL